MATNLTPDQEAAFLAWIRGLPWHAEFVKQYGEAPNLDDPDYDYRAAWLAGIEPEQYAPDGGRYHWPSVTPQGAPLKSENHPTAWMEAFMQQYGMDPNTASPRGLLADIRKEQLSGNGLLAMPAIKPRRGLLSF